MKYVPSWLHCRLLHFAWYRRKCGIPQWSGNMSAVTAAVLREVHARLDFAATLNREYDQGAFDRLKTEQGTIKIRRPVQYTQRAGD